MPDATPARRPRRWWPVVRVVLILLLVLLVLLVLVALAVGPAVAIRLAQPRLPWSQDFRHGSVTVQQIASAPVAGLRPEAQVVGSPAVLRGIASEALQRWLPPLVLRGGQNVVGELSLPILRPQPFSWQLLVAGDDNRPLANLLIPHGDLTQFLRLNGQTVLTVGGAPIMRCIYRVDWGRIEDDDEPGQSPLVRRQKVVARGSILLIAGQSQRVLKVDRLAGHAWTTFTQVPDGYRIAMRVAIEDAQAEAITLPLVGDARPMLLKQLETAANDGLADGLEGVVLPPWFPLGVRVDVTVE
jgi:hypothetical protein